MFAYGLLVKYKRLLEGELVDESKKRIVDGGLEFGVVGKSPFFLHFASMMISYRPVTNKIGDAQFRRLFCRLLEQGHDNFFVEAEIIPVSEDQELLLAIDTFRRINWLRLELHPTNPDNTPEFRSVDNRLKILEARQLKEELIGGPDGLNKDALKDDEAYKGIIMAQHGYGNATMNGIDAQGRTVTLSTEGSPTTVRVAASESPNELLDAIIGPFRRLISKGNHDEIE